MANEQNLKPRQLSNEEATEMGRKGGKASVQKRRERKALKEQLEILLNLPLKNDELKSKLASLGVKDEEMNNQMAMTIAIYQQAMKGNTKAYEIIRDTVGEKPIERQEVKNVDTDWFIDG